MTRLFRRYGLLPLIPLALVGCLAYFLVRGWQLHVPIQAADVLNVELNQGGSRGFRTATSEESQQIIRWFNAGSFRRENASLAGPGCTAVGAFITLRSGERVSISAWGDGTLEIGQKNREYLMQQADLARFLQTAAHGCEGPGSSSPEPPPGPVTTGQDTSLQDWRPPEPGVTVAWDSLPQETRQELLKGDRSPDGRWVAARIGSIQGRLPQVWVAATDESSARLVQQDLPMNGAGLWSPDGTYLYYSNADDSWREVDPQSGQVKPFLPRVLTGQKAGNLRFSSNGQRLLYVTGLCYCDRPAQQPLTTFVVRTDGMDQKQVGVGVDARWEGDQILLSPDGFYPPNVHTGTPEVDRVIQALAQKDGSALAGLVKMSRVACTAGTPAMGGFPCPQGTPDGTVLDAFPWGGCELSFQTSREMVQAQVRTLAAAEPRVYAVYRIKPRTQGATSPAFGVIVAGLKEPFMAQTIQLDAGGSIVEQYHCGGPANMLPSDAEFLLAAKR